MTRKILNNVEQIHLALKKRYKNFRHYNKCNPLAELLFILCSTKTSEKSYLGTYKRLINSFPKFEDILKAKTSDIEKVLEKGGLSVIKAKSIKKIFTTLAEKFGKPTLTPLKEMSTKECEVFLTSLPGIGLKTARCVIMYSLNRPVFPVDTHCWRISRRLGWIRPNQKNARLTDREQNRLQNKIPEKFRFALHVNMVSLGRELCLKNPLCLHCPIVVYCKQIGVKKLSSTNSNRTN